MPPADPAANSARTATTQARSWAPITPTDVDLATFPKALYIGGAGNLVLRGSDGNDATFPVVAGQILPLQPTQVRTTTTATNIVALF